MSLKERIEENLESEKISATLTDYLEDMGGQLLDEARQAPEFELTPKAEKRLARTLRRNLAKQNPVHWRRRKFVLAAVVLLLFLGAVHTSAIRSAIGNYFLTRKEESLDFSETPRPDQGTWHTDTSMPTDLPPGYQLSEVRSYEGVMEFVYTKSWKPDIRLYIYADNTCLRLDSENADEIGRITINRREGYYIIKKNRIQLFWGKTPAFRIEGPSAERDALVRMAESIVYSPADGQKYKGDV